jgi:ribosomal protein S18 acetylase RimI-like enzyme
MNEAETYSIRKATSSDIPYLMALDHGYSTDHVWQMSVETEPNQVGVTFREIRLPRPMRVIYPRDPERLADEWNLRAALLMAEEEEGILGYVSLVQGPALDSGWITDLVVNLRYRRRGVASRLIRAARDWCHENNMKRMFIEMQSKNYPAICLARKFGFVFAGYSDHYYPEQDIALFFSLELH